MGDNLVESFVSKFSHISRILQNPKDYIAEFLSVFWGCFGKISDFPKFSQKTSDFEMTGQIY